MKIKLLSLVLALLLLIPLLASCAGPDQDLEIKIMTLNGTTGFGFAKLIQDRTDGKTELNYTISVETDASNVTAALINGTTDIAALPTNAASVVYNKTEGAVQVIALNTLGVLYVVSDGSISSFADLKGKTVYCPAQNPAFIFSYLCSQNGLEVGTDITIDTTYAQPADLRGALASGAVSLAVLPEPMVTMVLSANTALQVSLDLTEEWGKVGNGKTLTQGCLVVRREFAENHKKELDAFLAEYAESVSFLTENTEEAAKAIVAAGIFANEGVAKKAIPNCNVCYIDGAEMKSALSGFLEIMSGVNAASIGGAVPGDDFYYAK